MIEKKIELLKNQIKKLELEDFDLNAWKNSTILILERIFGKNNQKIKQIENIKYDLGSWSLRDTLATTTNTEICKRNGKEILEVSINELENLGLPEKEGKNDITKNQIIDISIILSAIEDELKVSQFKEIKEILAMDLKEEEKKKIVIEKIKKFGSHIAYNIIANILINKQISANI